MVKMFIKKNMEKKNHADKLTVSQTSHFIALKQIVYHFVLVVLTFIFSTRTKCSVFIQ